MHTTRGRLNQRFRGYIGVRAQERAVKRCGNGPDVR